VIVVPAKRNGGDGLGHHLGTRVGGSGDRRQEKAEASKAGYLFPTDNFVFSHGSRFPLWRRRNHTFGSNVNQIYVLTINLHKQRFLMVIFNIGHQND
jgi:hypothetical protein